MTDVKIIETLNGGDLELQGNDLALVHGVENTPYLALFGGSDWSGNFLTDRPFNATTELVLNTVTLNSDGRLQIEKAVNADLAFLSDIPGTTWSTTVSIVGPNKVKIDVLINGELFSYLWNPYELPVPPVYEPAELCPIITGLEVTAVTDTQINIAWNSGFSPVYAYAYNTTGVPPDREDYVETLVDQKNFAGLTPGTTYYFFVVNKCTQETWSEPVMITQDTAAGAPTLPVTLGLVVDMVSSYGLQTSGTDVTGWLDQSGLSNDASVTLGASNPEYVPNVFGTEPAVRFVSGDQLMTNMLLDGMVMKNAVTCFIVASLATPIAATDILGYYNSYMPGETGGFVLASQQPLATTELIGSLRGDVGFSVSKIPTVATAPIVFTAVFDKSAVSPEVEVLQNDSAAGLITVVNSNNTNNFSVQPLRIGGTFVGDLGRVVMYSRKLTGLEQTSVVNYLKTKYSIP